MAGTPSEPAAHSQAHPGLSVAPRGQPWALGASWGSGGHRPSAPRQQCGVDTPDAGSRPWAHSCGPHVCRGQNVGGLLRVCPDADRDLGGGWPASLPGVLVLQPGAPGRFLALPVLPPNFTQERMKEFHWSGNGESEADLCLSLCLRLSLPLSLSGPLSLSAALSPGLWSLPWPQGPSQAASPLHQGPRTGRG